jgi:hypothetical protein
MAWHGQALPHPRQKRFGHLVCCQQSLLDGILQPFEDLFSSTMLHIGSFCLQSVNTQGSLFLRLRCPAGLQPPSGWITVHLLLHTAQRQLCAAAGYLLLCASPVPACVHQGQDTALRQGNIPGSDLAAKFNTRCTSYAAGR